MYKWWSDTSCNFILPLLFTGQDAGFAANRDDPVEKEQYLRRKNGALAELYLTPSILNNNIVVLTTRRYTLCILSIVQINYNIVYPIYPLSQRYRIDSTANRDID